MKLRTLIADDEPLARERLKQLLAPDQEIEIVGESRNGNEVVATLKGTQIDLLFLDIQMPGSSGFDVIENVGVSNMPLTVFVTAHSEFAVEAFAVHALHYLVKPVERQRLEEAVSRVKERVRLRRLLRPAKKSIPSWRRCRGRRGGRAIRSGCWRRMGTRSRLCR